MKTSLTLAAIMLWAGSLAGCASSTARTSEQKATTDNQEAMNTPQTTTTNRNDAIVNIETSVGNIKVRLFGDTPLHTSNFVKLAKEGYYDGVLFHRVINDFMVQAGDPNSKTATAGQALGDGDPDYTIAAEFVYPKHFHHRGALAAARMGDQVNPERRSSGSQFYIVTGKKFSEGELAQMEKQMQVRQQREIFQRLTEEHKDTIMAMRRNRDQAGLQELQDELIAITESEAAAHPVAFTAEQKKAYTTEGGTPHLDGQYTVFGEVIEGMDVVDKIQKVETNSMDRPVQDVKIIKMTVEQ